jgi:hypothetical protein
MLGMPLSTGGESLGLEGLFLIKSAALCRGSCFLSYTAESSHHLMAALTPKEALCQEEIITSKTSEKSCN